MLFLSCLFSSPDLNQMLVLYFFAWCTTVSLNGSLWLDCLQLTWSMKMLPRWWTAHDSLYKLYLQLSYQCSCHHDTVHLDELARGANSYEECLCLYTGEIPHLTVVLAGVHPGFRRSVCLENWSYWWPSPRSARTLLHLGKQRISRLRASLHTRLALAVVQSWLKFAVCSDFFFWTLPTLCNFKLSMKADKYQQSIVRLSLLLFGRDSDWQQIATDWGNYWSAWSGMKKRAFEIVADFNQHSLWA